MGLFNNTLYAPPAATVRVGLNYGRPHCRRKPSDTCQGSASNRHKTLNCLLPSSRCASDPAQLANNKRARRAAVVGQADPRQGHWEVPPKGQAAQPAWAGAAAGKSMAKRNIVHLTDSCQRTAPDWQQGTGGASTGWLPTLSRTMRSMSIRPGKVTLAAAAILLGRGKDMRKSCLTA